MYTAQGKIDQRQQIEQHLPMVRRIALSLVVKVPASVELDDLIQAGTMGLLDALNRYRPGDGTPVAAFAAQRIRGAMLDELRSCDWLPRSSRREARAMNETIRQLEQSLGRPPEEHEIAAAMGVSLDKYHDHLADTNSSQLLPFEDMMAEGGEGRLTDHSTDTPHEKFADAEKRRQLAESIEGLPEREKIMMALYYQEDLNLKEIGAVMGITEGRVCQIHSQALRRLRARLTATD